MPLDAFTAKTHAELAKLVRDAGRVRRNRPAHPWCSDRAACRHCAEIRSIHLRLDDHLDQLEIGPEAPPEPIDVRRVQARKCGICGRRRYSNFSGAVICMACDHPAGATFCLGGKWVGMDGEVAS